MKTKKLTAVLFATAVTLLTTVAISAPAVAGMLSYQCGDHDPECQAVAADMEAQQFQTSIDADMYMETQYPMWWCSWSISHCLIWHF